MRMFFLTSHYHFPFLCYDDLLVVRPSAHHSNYGSSFWSLQTSDIKISGQSSYWQTFTQSLMVGLSFLYKIPLKSLAIGLIEVQTTICELQQPLRKTVNISLESFFPMILLKLLEYTQMLIKTIFCKIFRFYD